MNNMTNNTCSFPMDSDHSDTSGTAPQNAGETLPVWRASFRMALVAAASVVAVGLMATGLTGCADMSGIAPQSSLRDAPSLGLKADAGMQATAQAPLAAEWWRDFGDEQLNTLVAQALQTSPSLKLAQARLARAQAVIEVADAATLPQLTGQLDLTRQRYTANGAVPPPLAGSINESGTAAVQWQLGARLLRQEPAALDAALGGARRAGRRRSRPRAAGQQRVARTYFQLVRLREQLAVAERTLEQRGQQLQLVRHRVNAGLDTNLELRQSEGALPETRQQIEALQEQAQIARNALAALVGKPDVPELAAVPALKSLAATSLPALPADLLGRRADVAAARWRVEAANQDVKPTPRRSSIPTSTWSPSSACRASAWAT
jgi:outer membrane protein TolC